MRGAARQQAAEAHKYEPRRAPRPPGPEKPAPAARAAALPAPAASADVIGAWKSSVAARIAGNKSYPESARLRGAGGTAMVALAIGSGGQLASASVSRSSGQSDLDAAALSAVRRSAPFAPPPQGAPRAFAVPFRYGIH